MERSLAPKQDDCFTDAKRNGIFFAANACSESSGPSFAMDRKWQWMPTTWEVARE